MDNWPGAGTHEGRAASGPVSFLTAESCVRYLIARGLLDVPSIVRHGLHVDEIPGRNRNFRVVCGPAQRWFVKQAPTEEIGVPGPLGIEAALYHWAASSGLLRDLCPRWVHHDSTESILILELESAAVSFHELTTDHGPDRYSQAIRLLAGALAATHQIPLATLEAIPGVLPDSPPWVMDIGRPAPGSLRGYSPAQLKVLQGIQRHEGAMDALQQLRESWRSECLIHGDIKWNNLLLRVPGGGRPDSVLILDWELAQLGDPAWDVGAGFHALLTEAILGLDLGEAISPSEAVVQMSATIPGLHQAHHVFWQEYRAVAGLDDQAAVRMLDRLPRMTALRLIKSAYEWAQAELVMPRRAAGVLQLGLNMLCHPAAALGTVLGLREGTP